MASFSYHRVVILLPDDVTQRGVLLRMPVPDPMTPLQPNRPNVERLAQPIAFETATGVWSAIYGSPPWPTITAAGVSGITALTQLGPVTPYATLPARFRTILDAAVMP